MIPLLFVMAVATMGYFGMAFWLPVWAPLAPVF